VPAIFGGIYNILTIALVTGTSSGGERDRDGTPQGGLLSPLLPNILRQGRRRTLASIVRTLTSINGHGRYRNAGASHMNDADRAALFAATWSGIPHGTAPPPQSCLTNRRIRTRLYGPIRTVVW